MSTKEEEARLETEEIVVVVKWTGGFTVNTSSALIAGVLLYLRLFHMLNPVQFVDLNYYTHCFQCCIQLVSC